MSYQPQIKTSYRKQITMGDLINGWLTIAHNLSEDYPGVQLWSNDRELLLPDNIVSLDPNNIQVSLKSFGNIIGNWTVVVLK